MHAELTSRDKADDLIALHGVGAIAVLVDRIADAVRLCDDQAVDSLDRLLQIVEQRFEEPWRAMRPLRN
ncbi:MULTISPECIES: hypothetical protein [unclassified Sphingomonas]|uniref:hypothetical protein n=1 Tax=unclassified Sphingomonas TaxID=196159 RepID=UPI0007016BB4|nr:MULTISPECIES: hypothetical protein [unclassified Sphingomonas]KQX20044.1 hypothetical protein ASD17_09050 [Sphingomonas sp. Root1294]KQY67294.1 hypothetical protein ASD39_09110 [Sphingomonas sp. Root50]KRB90669.1 hypothetical protein ASE22_10120 [Sphingomonas sp. Root720]